MPKDAIVDAGFTVNAGAVPTAVLTYVDHVNNTLTLAFDLENVGRTTFTVPDDVAEFTTVWSDPVNIPSADNTLASQCPSSNRVRGFVVIGNVNSLIAVAANNNSFVFITGADLEPATVDAIGNRSVASITLCNTERTLSPALAQCGVTSYVRTAPYRIRNLDGVTYKNVSADFQCITGDVTIRPGYACNVTQSDTAQTLTISASQSAADGLACRDIALDSQEAAILASGQSLTGIQRCDNVVRSINGVGGPNLVIKGRNGVAVTTTDEPAIVITIGSDADNKCGLPS